MPEIVVAAASRNERGKNSNRRLRQQGSIPGILYGADKTAVSLAVSPREIGAILKSASGENTLFDLEIQGVRHKVILKEYQREPIRGALLHADFFEVALDKPLEVTVHIEVTGTAVGVKTQGGMLDFVTRELKVECLPSDIPEKVVVDVSALELGKHLRVADVTLPPKVKVLSEPGLVIVHIVAPKAEEVTETAEAAAGTVDADKTEPEVIKKGKTTTEEESSEDKGSKKEKK